MQWNRFGCMTLCLFLIPLFGCSSAKPSVAVDRTSSKPGTMVLRGTIQFRLLGRPLAEGQALPSVPLVDAQSMETVDLSKSRGRVLFLSVVPSIDTRTCEVQTHYLGEEGDRLSPAIHRITISRDTPFAQKRFAREAKLTDILYLSDYKKGAFGEATGLLMEDILLLARSVILVDKKGIVRYIQVVPELTRLPDMERAFQEAERLAQE